MTSGVEIIYPDRDVKDLFSQIERAQTDLGKSLSRSVRWAGWFACTSLAAATPTPSKDVVKSAKRRVVREVRDGSRRKRGDLKTFAVNRYYGGSSKEVQFKAASKSDANKSSAAKISFWGMAKASWMWTQKRLGSGARFGFATAKAKDRASRFISVDIKPDKYNPSVTITNRLNYIRKALDGGEVAVDRALSNAAKRMEKSIDDAIEKKLTGAIR